jgi:hypothetical protein
LGISLTTVIRVALSIAGPMFVALLTVGFVDTDTLCIDNGPVWSTSGVWQAARQPANAIITPNLNDLRDITFPLSAQACKGGAREKKQKSVAIRHIFRDSWSAGCSEAVIWRR